MRRVLVYKNDLKEEVLCEGNFHQWGEDSLETADGNVARFTVAIVEKDNGEVITAYPNSICFITDNTDTNKTSDNSIEVANKEIYSDNELDFFKFAASQGGHNYLFYNFSNYTEDKNGLYADNFEDKSNSDFYITASLDFSNIELTKIYDKGEGIEEVNIPLADTFNKGLCIGALLLAKERSKK